MTSTTELGQAGLSTWRAAIADRIAPPAAKRTRWSEDQVRAALGAVFLAVATVYVVSAWIRLIRTARG
jgi:hypothetical protein